MTEPGFLYVFETKPGEYDALRVPPNWEVLVGDLEMADTMRHVFTSHPTAPYYGWLSDDTHPRTVGWDVTIARTTVPLNLVDCNDLFQANDPAYMSGSLTAGFCWSGDLVRAVGWWALPEVRQAGIDDAWVYLILQRHPSLRVHLPNVIVEHLSWKNEKRLKDETDEWVRGGVSFIREDFKILQRWKDTGAAEEAVARIQVALSP
jgi:hypothetical protein